MKVFRLALAQINSTVGAFSANRARILAAARQASDAGAHLCVFPELALCGYPPEDLVLKPHFVRMAEDELQTLAAEMPPDLVAVIGLPIAGRSRPRNAAALVSGGKVAAAYSKHLLPNYGVFDEKRLFEAGNTPLCIQCGGARFALHICEDSWQPSEAHLRKLASLRLTALLNLSASPFHRGKTDERSAVLQRTSQAIGAPLAYCNLVGGQDELVFDGGSLWITPSGDIPHRAKRFEEDMLFIDLPLGDGMDLIDAAPPDNVEWVILSDTPTPPPPRPVLPPPPPMDDLEEVYHALTLGLRDYADKNGFRDVLVAISGGIDSALVAALAVDAIGAERVTGVTLPTRFSSSGTLGDAHLLAQNLGIRMAEIPIQGLVDGFLERLEPQWPGRAPDVTEENLQARIRGTLVMALSNKFNRLVVATGNKSEMATGYATLYGDMNGGFALIKDVPKTLVFDLSRWINTRAGREVIPLSTIERPPSAELRDNQKDSDSLPPYDQLDAILELYIEKDLGRADIIDAGHDPALVARVIRLVDRSEYKRRQAPPGVKITPKAFGRDRRMPLTNHYPPPVP